MEILIVVDVQNDFLENGALEVPGGNRIIPVVNKLIDRFEHTIYTQDWHPAGHKSFASSHKGKEIGDIIPLGRAQQYLWPDHCVQGTLGAEFHPDLHVLNDARVFQKGTNPEVDSYSAFYDNLKIQSTGLTSFLRDNAYTKLFICGLASDYCVKFSVLDALEDGFDTTLVTDATAAVNVNPDDHENALQMMHDAGAHLITSTQLL